MSEESKNPFEQPLAEFAPVRDTSRRRLLLGALVIVALDQLSREITQTALVSVMISSGDTAQIATQYTYIAVASIIGPIIGALLGLTMGMRRAIFFGAALGALGEAALAIQPMRELALIGSVARGVMTTPLFVLVGRRLIGQPELRDSWFAGSWVAISIASALGSTSMIFTNVLPSWIAFALSAALTLGIIPVALVVLEDAGSEEREERQFPWALFVSAMLLTLLDGFTASMFVRKLAQNPIAPAVGLGALPFFASVVAAVAYLARHAPGREDAARTKIVLGGVAALFAAALSFVPGAIAPWGGSLFENAARVLIGPVALGIAATRPRERDASLLVAAWSAATVLAGAAGGWISALFVR